jgi:hypothetical protein
MGHYASEMTAPVRHEPEVLLNRRAEAREGAAFRWHLAQQYEDQGEWIRSDETLVCPRCFAKVPAVLRADHDEWHTEAAA